MSHHLCVTLGDEGHDSVMECGAVLGVPGVVTAEPRGRRGEGREQEVHRPGHDSVVVPGDEGCDDADRHPDTWQNERRGQVGQIGLIIGLLVKFIQL